MGQDIDYCFECRARISSEDLKAGNVYRLFAHVYCSDCAPEAAVRIASPRPSRGRRANARPSASGSGKRGLWIGIGVGGFVLLILIVVVAMSGGSSDEVVKSTPDPAPPELPTILKRARSFVLQSPDDLSGQLDLYQQALSELEDTRWYRKAETEFDSISVRLEEKRSLGEEILKSEISALILNRKFGEALMQLESAQGRFRGGRWKEVVQGSVRDVKSAADSEYHRLLPTAVAAVKGGGQAEGKRFVEQVRGWGMDEYVPRLELVLAAVKIPSAHWKFDEGEGVQAADSMRKGNGARLENGATWQVGSSPTNPSALRLDGKNDYVSLGRNLPYFRNVTAGTLSAWIQPRGGDEEIFSRIIGLSVHRDEPTTKTRARLKLVKDPNGKRFKLVAGAKPRDHGDSQSLETNQWMR